jgi:hypothetical protein
MLPGDAHHHLVEMPMPRRLRSKTGAGAALSLARTSGPSVGSSRRRLRAALGQQLFDVPVAGCNSALMSMVPAGVSFETYYRAER